MAPGTPLGGERPPRRRPRDDPDRMDVEAAQGPNAAGTRVDCPVPTCPRNDPRRARGWASDASMKAHIGALLAGSFRENCREMFRTLGCKDEVDNAAWCAVSALARPWPARRRPCKGMASSCRAFKRSSLGAPLPCGTCPGELVTCGRGP